MLCCLCKSQAQKDRERTEELAETTRINQVQPNEFTVSIKHKDESSCTTYQPLPVSWPNITREVAHIEAATKKWQLVLSPESASYIQICGPRVIGMLGNNPREYKWSIKPLAIGTAFIQVQYVTKDGHNVEKEETITITVTD